jgi:hypothetical protein
MQNLVPEVDDAVDYLVCTLEYDEFLTGGKAHHGIGRNFDVLNEIGVDDKRDSVDAR